MFKKRKLISIMLTVSMMLTLFPFAAFAEEGGQAGAEQTQQEPAQSADVATQLPEAVDGVITLKQDVTVTALPTNATIDLKGYNLTYNSMQSVASGENEVLTIKDSSVSNGARDGKLILTGKNKVNDSYFNPQKGATVNIENISVECNTSAFYPQGNAAAVNIINSDVKAACYGIATNAGADENNGVKINLINSKIVTTSVDGDNCAVMINVAGTLNIDNCEIIGDRQAVVVRAGNANITNSNIQVTNNFRGQDLTESWGQGNNIPSTALLVGDQNSVSYKADANVTVTNTTVKSEGENAKPAIYVSAEKGDKAQYNTNLTLDKANVTGNIVTADAAADKTATNVTLQNGTTVDGTVKVGAQKGDVVVKNSTVTAVETTQGHGNNVVIDNSTVTNALPGGNDFTVVDSNIGGQQVETNKVAMIGNTAYNTLDEAIKAAITSKADTTIVVLKDDKIDAAKYIINNKITLQKSASATTAPKIDVTVASGVDTKAFEVKPGAGLTLDGVTMTINGTKNANGNGNDGTGIDIYHSTNQDVAGAILTLKNGAVLNLTNLERATIASSTPANAKVVNQSTVTLEPGTTMTMTNIDGNGANGGNWTLDNATMKIDGCGSHGLSAHEIIAKNNSDITVNNAGLVGVTAKDLIVESGSDVTVSNSGKNLPKALWNDSSKEYTNVVEMQDGGKFVVKDSIVTLANNKNKNEEVLNKIFVNDAKTDIQGSKIDAELVYAETDATKDQIHVEYIVDGKVYFAITDKVGSNGKVEFTEPADPTLSGYTFRYWDYPSNVTVSGKKVYLTPVKDQNTYTFVAKFSSNTPAVTEYSVTVKKTDNGSVSVSPKRAEAGDKVTINVDPDKGYVVDAVVVTDKDGDKITVTKKTATKYTFTMPKSRVDVKVTFKAEQTEPEQPSEMPFVDVVKDAWYYPAVEYVYNNDLMNGTNGGLTFEPNVNLNRAMMAAVLYNMEGGPDCDKSGLFSDVADGMWYTDAVNWAASNNIVSGMPDGTYAPNQALTREQMASILYRYAEYKGIKTDARADLGKFTDGNTTSTWATDVVQWAVAEKLINGVGTELQPKGTATRAQVATVLMNYCENVAK